MFTIGDKVAYPMHGAGVIEGIEEQTILGTPRRYYVLRLSHSDMKVMVPVENSQQVGVRYIVGASDIDDVVSVLHSDSTPMSDNWNKRNRDNMEKLKTGDLKGITDRMANVLETVTIPANPVIDSVKKLIAENDSMGVLMSGSGPTVFGIYDNRDKELAQRVVDMLREKDEIQAAYAVSPYNIRRGM